MTIDLELPKKEELDKAKNIAIGTIGGIIAVKVISAAVGTAKEVKQNREIKKLKRRVDELEARVDELENEKHKK